MIIGPAFMAIGATGFISGKESDGAHGNGETTSGEPDQMLRMQEAQATWIANTRQGYGLHLLHKRI